MNKPLLIAALLTAFIAAVHLFAGGADVAAPLLASSLAEEPRLTLYAVWHLISVTLVLSAIALYVCALPQHAVAGRYLALFISVLWLCFGAIFLVVALTQPGRDFSLKCRNGFYSSLLAFLAYGAAFLDPLGDHEKTDSARAVRTGNGTAVGGPSTSLLQV
jgi:hypothetical protein